MGVSPFSARVGGVIALSCRVRAPQATGTFG